MGNSISSNREFYQWDQVVGICIVLSIVGSVTGAILGNIIGGKESRDLFSDFFGIVSPIVGLILTLRHNKKYFGKII